MEGYENGNAFYGTHGFLLLNSNRNFRLFNQDNDLIEEMQADDENPIKSVSDKKNPLSRIHQNLHPLADIELKQHSFTVCHMGNIASHLKRTLFFDGRKEQFINDDEANRLLSRAERAPWVL